MPKRSTSSLRQPSRGGSPIVGVIMGSKSDLKHMSAAVEMLRELDVPCEVRIVSAHRTPDWMFEYASSAETRGLEVIIAAAGGAAHLPGMIASKTILPVLGVPMPATALNGVDALLSIVQMPRGVPVGTLAIGEPGAANAAILAASIVSQTRPELRERLRAWRAGRTAEVMRERDVDHARS
jgi:5-(carboxyamino)imidazole ribonucleotide mutase